MFLGEHGDDSSTRAGVESTVRVQGRGAEKNEVGLREDRGEEGEENVSTRKAGGGEHFEKLFTFEKGSRVDDDDVEGCIGVLFSHAGPGFE